MAGAGHGDYFDAEAKKWGDSQAQRIQYLADDAIRSLATGNVTKAIAIHNHDVPNGEEIVGYKPIKDANGNTSAWQFQYSNGKTEMGTLAGREHVGAVQGPDVPGAGRP